MTFALLYVIVTFNFYFVSTKSLFVTYGHVSNESIDFILLSLLALNAILLTYLVNTFFLAYFLLYTCCDFNLMCFFILYDFI